MFNTNIYNDISSSLSNRQHNILILIKDISNDENIADIKENKGNWRGRHRPGQVVFKGKGMVAIIREEKILEVVGQIILPAD